MPAEWNFSDQFDGLICRPKYLAVRIIETCEPSVEKNSCGVLAGSRLFV